MDISTNASSVQPNPSWLHSLHALPTKRNLKSLDCGFTLDVGCGDGSKLALVEGVGVDTNPHCIEQARSRGLSAYLPDEFEYRYEAHSFDTLLFSHVLETMAYGQAFQLVKKYMRFLQPDGQVIFVTSQELGYQNDPTHVEWMPDEKLHSLMRELRLSPTKSYSYPFPRWAGKWFAQNDFVVVGEPE